MTSRKLQFFATDVSYLTLGSSLRAVKGQRVLVIGNPEGLEGTVSDGIISAFRAGRTMIQITAPVSPGSSGSPVLDESGDVIGIATQVLKEGQNLNFAISAETIRDAIAKPTVAPVTPTPSPERGSAEDYLNRAEQEMRGRNYQSAISYCVEAIRLKPDWGQAYSDRGMANFDLGQYDNAVGDYTAAIRLDPSMASVNYLWRAYAWFNLDQYGKAVSDFTAVIRREPKWISAYSQRGLAYFYLGQYGKAISAYSEAIRLWPDDADLYEGRAVAFDKLGNRSRAEQDRKKAKELRGP